MDSDSNPNPDPSESEIIWLFESLKKMHDYVINMERELDLIHASGQWSMKQAILNLSTAKEQVWEDMQDVLAEKMQRENINFVTIDKLASTPEEWQLLEFLVKYVCRSPNPQKLS